MSVPLRGPFGRRLLPTASPDQGPPCRRGKGKGEKKGAEPKEWQSSKLRWTTQVVPEKRVVGDLGYVVEEVTLADVAEERLLGLGLLWPHATGSGGPRWSAPPWPTHRGLRHHIKGACYSHPRQIDKHHETDACVDHVAERR